ncbi:MAG TPA: AAA family ATPase [Gemmatimonadaceae bacterium]|nr:AAA family ATPase [Gemmatimonadaceae bacterium]
MTDSFPLCLNTLGELRLAGAAADALSSPRKELALLAFLARRSPRAVARAELMTLLWGERTEARARQSLRQALLELKRAIGAGLSVDADSAALAPGVVEWDVAAFERDVQAGRLEEAVDRWHGEFLEDAEDAGGENFRQWVDGERHGLRRRLAWALEHLADDAEARGAWDEVVAWTERWAEAEPSDEAVQRRLIAALRLAGRPAEALARHATFTAFVREELGRDPSEEFARLGREQDEGRWTTAAPPSPGSAALFTPDLVGRAAAFATLSAAWGALRHGERAIALVEGDAGIGKTRLCEEFLRWLGGRPEPPLILRARGYESGQPTEWAATRELLAGLMEEPALAGASPASLAELAALLPALRERFPRLAPPRGDERSLCDAAVQAVSAVAEETPVVIFLDDFPSADPSTQRLMLALARRGAGAVMLLFTARTGEAAAASALAELRAIPKVGRLALQPLQCADLEALLASMLELSADTRRELATRLHAESGGNPFFATEIVAALVDDGYLVFEASGVWRLAQHASGQPLPLPPSVREALGRRLARLSDAGRRAIEAAAVLNEPLDPALVAATAELSPSAFSAALDELIAHRLLREIPAHPGNYELVHELSRRIAYGLLGAPEREQLHRAAATALAPAARTDANARAALHYHRGRSRREPRAGRWRRWYWMAAAVVLVVGGVVAAGAAWWHAKGSSISVTTVAVLPFTVHGGSDLAYLGEGMVDLLSTSLDGAGGLHTADPRAVLTAVGRDPVPGPVKGSAVARRLGAGRYVLGNVVEGGGGTLRITASLYDASTPGDAIASAAVEGVPDSIFGLVDALTARLISGEQRGPASRLAQVAAVTTTSLPALKAYLDGEHAFRHHQLTDALPAFQRAIRADSTFALAWYRVATTADWYLQPALARHAAEEAVRYSGRLSDHDRQLVQAFAAYTRGDADEAERLVGPIINTDPHDAEAWLLLGSVHFYLNAPRGRSISLSRHPLQQVLAIDPDNWQALLNLSELAGRSGEREEADTLLHRYMAASAPDSTAPFILAYDAFLRRDPAAEDSILARLQSDVGVNIVLATWYTAMDAQDLEGAERLARLLVNSRRVNDQQAFGWIVLSYLATAQGRWQEARADLAAAAPLDSVAALEYGAVLSAAPFLTVTPAQLDSLRRTLRRLNGAAVPPSVHVSIWPTVHNGIHQALRAYLLGVLSARAGADSEATRYAAMVKQLSGPPLAPALPRALAASIRARLAWRHQKPAAALARLDSSRMNVPDAYILASPFYSQAAARYLHAEVLHELGRDEEALDWYQTFGVTTPYDLPYLGPSLYAEGEIYAQRGDRETAIARYSRFITLWKDCDAELRPMVDEARRRVARLEGAGGKDSREPVR